MRKKTYSYELMRDKTSHNKIYWPRLVFQNASLSNFYLYVMSHIVFLYFLQPCLIMEFPDPYPASDITERGKWAAQ